MKHLAPLIPLIIGWIVFYAASFLPWAEGLQKTKWWEPPTLISSMGLVVYGIFLAVKWWERFDKPCKPEPKTDD